MLLRAIDSATSIRGDGRGESVELMEAMKKTFEVIATGKVATSAHEARSFGFLSDSDRITMNRERVLSDAKARALELARAGYEPPQPRTDLPAPGENILAALKMGVHLMRQGGYISDHEVKIGSKIAEVLWRERFAGNAGERAVYSRSRTRGVQIAVRGEEDPGADSVHAEDGKDAEKLSN
jgi:3-hydroxyacyl-CoA dehydrogenase